MHQSSAANQVFHDVVIAYGIAHPTIDSITETGFTATSVDGTYQAIQRSTSFVYDSVGRLASTAASPGGSTYFDYFATGVNDSGLLRFVHRLMPSGQLLSAQVSNYNEFGMARRIDHPNGLAEILTFVPGTRRLATRVRGADSWAFTYNVAGDVESITEANGRATVLTYGDTRRRLTSVDTYDSPSRAGVSFERTNLVYDPAGRATSVEIGRVAPNGVFTKSRGWYDSYDTRGFPLGTNVGPGLASQTITRDPLISSFASSVSVFSFLSGQTPDAFGRPTSYSRYDGTTPTTHTLEYPTWNAPTSHPSRVVDPMGGATNYVYNDFGDLVRAESSATPGAVVRHLYDSQGRLQSTIESNGGVTTRVYDSIGRLSETHGNSNRPGTIGPHQQFFYDDAAGSVACNFTYTSGAAACAYRRGRIAAIETRQLSGGTPARAEFDYTIEGRVRAERMFDGTQINYEYGPGGQRTRTHIPRFGRGFQYQMDATAGNVLDGSETRSIVRVVGNTASGTWADNIDRNPLGQITSARLFTDASVTNMVASFSGLGEPATVQVLSGTWSIINHQYTNAVAGPFQSSLSVGVESRSHTYDAFGRLKSTWIAAPPSSTAVLHSTYDYNGRDDRTTSVDASGATTTYTYTLDALSSIQRPGGRTITYSHHDAPAYSGKARSGDVETTSGIGPNQRSYEYDGLGRLTTITINDAVAGAAAGTNQTHTITIEYDYASRPLVVTNRNPTSGAWSQTTYFWSPEGQLLASRFVPNMNVPTSFNVNTYVEMGQLVGIEGVTFVNSVETTSDRWWVLRDRTGLPVQAWRGTTVLGRWSYGPYGELLTTTGFESRRGPGRFWGHIGIDDSSVETWTGSTLTRRRPEVWLTPWRAYDPDVGAFTSPDPARFDGSLLTSSIYGYADASPTLMGDSDGRHPGILIGATLGAIYQGYDAYHASGGSATAAMLGFVYGGVKGAILGGMGPFAAAVTSGFIAAGEGFIIDSYAERRGACLSGSAMERSAVRFVGAALASGLASKLGGGIGDRLGRFAGNAHVERTWASRTVGERLISTSNAISHGSTPSSWQYAGQAAGAVSGNAFERWYSSFQ